MLRTTANAKQQTFWLIFVCKNGSKIQKYEKEYVRAREIEARRSSGIAEGAVVCPIVVTSTNPCVRSLSQDRLACLRRVLVVDDNAVATAIAAPNAG